MNEEIPLGDVLAELLAEHEDELVVIRLQGGHCFEIISSKCASLIENNLIMIIDKRYDRRFYIDPKMITVITVEPSKKAIIGDVMNGFNTCTRTIK